VFGRLIGVLTSPRSTFASLAAKPRWADVLVVTFLTTLGCNVAFLATEVGRQALVDQWERTELAFGGTVDDARYAALEERSRMSVPYGAATALLTGPVLTVGLSAVLLPLFNRAARGAATFSQVLAIVAHAGVLLALRQIVATPLNFTRETLANPTSAGMFFAAMLDEGSPPARFLGIIDLFVIWWIVSLALGMAVLYRRSARPILMGFIGAYLAFAAVLASVMALTGGTA
jgi:hypothetical protein